MGAEYSLFDLDRIDDVSGTLHVAEFAAIGGPFRRFYFITDVPADVRRGGHAHKVQSECLICIRGRVTVHIEAHDERTVIALETPGRALYLPGGYWRDLVDFSSDATLGVLASDAFDEADYIRDREEFRRWERR